MLYDINPVILGGTNVFKMWSGVFNTGAINYRESTDGLTSWTASGSNPIVASGAFFPTVFKVGSTYYMFACSSETPLSIDRWTSSDGIAWTKTNVGVLVTGTAGSWDASVVVQLHLCDIIAGTWYAYYTGANAGGVFAGGLATSTDSGVTWIKNGGNPLITGLNSTNVAGFAFIKVGSTYYCWGQGQPPNAQLKAGGFNSIYRWSSASVSGPWTQLAVSGNQVATYYAASVADFAAFTASNQVADPSILYVPSLGNCYIYYDVGTAGAEGKVNQAVATGVTATQLVASYEGVVGVPSSGNPQLNLVTLATDNFTRANANPIGGNWSSLTASIVAQLLNNQATVATAATSGDSYWNALTWANDQWAQSTGAACILSDVGICMRMNTSGVATEYRLQWGTNFGSSGSYLIKSVVSGVATTLATITITANIGDTFLGVVNGTSVYAYWNGFLLGMAVDSAVTSGKAGFEIFGTTVADVALSAWSGGSFQDAPLISTTRSQAHLLD